ncbi:hypothetical protein [Fusobacterium nucleatum]
MIKFSRGCFIFLDIENGRVKWSFYFK